MEADNGLKDVDLATTAMKDVDLDVDTEDRGEEPGLEDDAGVLADTTPGAAGTSAAGALAGTPVVLSPPIFDRAGEGTRDTDLDDGEMRRADLEAGGALGARSRPPDDTAVGSVMEGVGEDEKPYNYICNLDKVNLGGPGWFNDVFKVSIEIHADRTWMDTLSLSLVPRHIFQRHCVLLDTSKPLTGTVTVEAPTAKKVWMAGLTVTFEEHLLTLDSDGGELVGALEAKVALGQVIDGKTTFGFSLDLQFLENHRGWPVRETYVGDLMALRHRILVAAQRPWYTFNVYHQVPLAMECVSYAPETDAGQDNEEGGPNHLLIISDCNGRCEFDFGVDSFHLTDVLAGSVRFTGIAKAIVSAHIMFLRAEFMYGEASETLVAEHTILGRMRETRVAPTVQAGGTQEDMTRAQLMSPFVDQRHVHFVQSQEEDCRMEEVVGDAEIGVRIELGTLALTPSHMSLTQDIALVNDEAELVGVRYYIRLIVEDDTGTAYWHTHEIFFHRADLTPSSAERGAQGDPDDPDNAYYDGDSGDEGEGTDYTRYSINNHGDDVADGEAVGETLKSSADAASMAAARTKETNSSDQPEPSVKSEKKPLDIPEGDNQEAASNGQHVGEEDTQANR